tara:strand:- start:370 stop:1227 length:858 start_codon:yes stop_codon:yes gene_type:complete
MIYKLKEGNIVKVIAPSSYIEDEKEFFNGIEIIKDWGLNVKFNNLTNRKSGYFAGNDNTRFSEVEKAQNSELIICAKGGWGASRVLEKVPKWKDKWFLGFSDNCSLLLSKYSKGSFGSIHGPTISTLSKEPKWSINRLRTFLFEGYLDDIIGTPLKEGSVRGELLISNLTIFCFLIGTSDMPNCDGKIIIFEDVNEDIYKIDRMFTYIRMSQVLKNIVGIGFGNFFDPKETNKIVSLENLIIDRFAEFNIPIISNLPVGHLTGNACLPYGYKGILNGNNGRLSII